MSNLNEKTNVVSDVSGNTENNNLNLLLNDFKNNNSIIGGIFNSKYLNFYYEVFNQVDIDNLQCLLLYCDEKYFPSVLEKIRYFNIDIEIYKSKDFEYSKQYRFYFSKKEINVSDIFDFYSDTTSFNL
jgi:hypothetical protein